MACETKISVENLTNSGGSRGVLPGGSSRGAGGAGGQGDVSGAGSAAGAGAATGANSVGANSGGAASKTFFNGIPSAPPGSAVPKPIDPNDQNAVQAAKISAKEKSAEAYRIEIYSFSNAEQQPIFFPAFLKDITDSYKSEWNPQRVLGKMDPIATYKNTSRTITLGFSVPSDSVEEAIGNLGKIDYIIRGMYPVYDSGPLGTAVLSTPPYFRIRFSNLIRNAANNSKTNTLRDGLMCYFTGFDFKPDNSSGYFIENGNLYPKLTEITLTLNVIHEHPLGKRENNGKIEARSGFNYFPRAYEAAPAIPTRSTSGTAPNNNGDVELNLEDAF